MMSPPSWITHQISIVLFDTIFDVGQSESTFDTTEARPAAFDVRNDSKKSWKLPQLIGWALIWNPIYKNSHFVA